MTASLFARYDCRVFDHLRGILDCGRIGGVVTRSSEQVESRDRDSCCRAGGRGANVNLAVLFVFSEVFALFTGIFCPAWLYILHHISYKLL